MASLFVDRYFKIIPDLEVFGFFSITSHFIDFSYPPTSRLRPRTLVSSMMSCVAGMRWNKLKKRLKIWRSGNQLHRLCKLFHRSILPKSRQAVSVKNFLFCISMLLNKKYLMFPIQVFKQCLISKSCFMSDDLSNHVRIFFGDCKFKCELSPTRLVLCCTQNGQINRAFRNTSGVGIRCHDVGRGKSREISANQVG